MSLQLQVAVAAAQGVIVLEGTLGRYEIPVEGPAGAEQVLRFTVPPGKHCFRIGCNTPGRRFPGDPRDLYFRVTCALREVDQD